MNTSSYFSTTTYSTSIDEQGSNKWTSTVSKDINYKYVFNEKQA